MEKNKNVIAAFPLGKLMRINRANVGAKQPDRRSLKWAQKLHHKPERVMSHYNISKRESLFK